MDRLIKFLDRVIFIFLCVLIFCLPFSITIIEICAGSAIALWLLKRILQRRLNRESLLPRSFLNWAIFLYLIVLIISAVQGTNFLISVRYLTRKTLEYLALYFIIIDTFNSKKRIRVFLGVLSCSILLITIDCVIQYFTHYEFLRQRVMFAGRIAGPFEYPDLFGNYLVMFLPLIIAFSLYKFKVRLFTYFLRIITFILIFLLFVNVTKGAWIGFAISFICLAMFCKKKKSLAFIPIFLVVAFFMLSLGFKSRILNEFNFNNVSIRHRFDLWQTGWNMFIDRPLLGQGLGTYMDNYEKFRQEPTYRPPGKPGIWYAHNSYLQMLAETGIFGTLPFLIIIFILFNKSLNIVIRYKNGYLSSLLLGVSTGLSAYLVQIFFDSTFYSLTSCMLFWYVLAVLVVVIRMIEKENLA